MSMSNYFRIQIVLLASLCNFVCFGSGESVASDSLATDTIALKEISVQNDAVTINNNKVTIVPTTTAKKLATDIKSLVQLTKSGIFSIVDGKITVNGKPVTISINGQLADDIDMRTFWAKNVIRLEYLKNSDNPAYLGASDVLNIVMKEYAVGGLTRLNADQKIPFDGDYNVASKLVYKALTVNAFANFKKKNEISHSEENTEEYQDVWFKGDFYPLLSQKENTKSDSRNNQISSGINFRQNSEKFRSVHSASYFSTNNRHNESGQTEIVPELFSKTLLQSSSKDHSRRFNFQGFYQLFYNDKLSFSGLWSFTRDLNNRNSLYDLSDQSLIITDVNENSSNFYSNLYAYYKPARNFSFSLMVTERYSRFNAHYTGNSESYQLHTSNDNNFVLSADWYPVDALSLSMQAAVNISKRFVNHSNECKEVLPLVYLSAYYALNNKSNVQAYLYYRKQQPMVNTLNELILQQSLLKWILGNPGLKAQQFCNFDALYYYRPSSNLNFGLSAGVRVKTNQSFLSYTAGGPKYDGIIGGYNNGSTEENYNAQLNSNIEIINNSVSFTPVLDFQYYRVKGVKNLFWFRPKLFVDYTIKDTRIYASCSAPEKILMNVGNEILRTYWQYDFGTDFAIGNLIFNVELVNIFNKRIKSTRSYQSPSYDFHKLIFDQGRHLMFSVTYTFDYGKKVDRNINNNSQLDINTSIL